MTWVLSLSIRICDVFITDVRTERKILIENMTYDVVWQTNEADEKYVKKKVGGERELKKKLLGDEASENSGILASVMQLVVCLFPEISG